MRIVHLLLGVLSAFALTESQKEVIEQKSIIADKSLQFLSFDEILPLTMDHLFASISHGPDVRHGVWVLLFGARWCVNTRIFTPTFLKVSRSVKDLRVGVHMAKVDCSVDNDVLYYSR
jgi:hypothetical protein